MFPSSGIAAALAFELSIHQGNLVQGFAACRAQAANAIDV
jgi:hypothetical protein